MINVKPARRTVRQWEKTFPERCITCNEHLNSGWLLSGFIFFSCRRLMNTLMSTGKNASALWFQHPQTQNALHAWLWHSFLSLFNYWRSQLHNKCWPLSSSSHNEHSHSMTSCLGEQTGIPCFPNFYPPMYFKEAQPVFSFFIYWREKVCHASSKCQH